MNRVGKLHQQAMDYAERAFAAKFEGNWDSAKDLFRKAFESESQAAGLVASDFTAEPTRSVLLRSAASLAVDCGELREAERLIALALSGNPPEEIGDELRDLNEQINFFRHLDLRGVELAPEEFQMSIAGKAVGLGIAYSDSFVERVKKVESLIYRTVERKMRRPYREGGRASAKVRHDYGVYLTLPRAASFAVTFKIGQPKEKLEIPEDQIEMDGPGFDHAVEIMDELLNCFELFEKSQEDALRARIQDEAYFNNFVGLAREITPDGQEVNLVGFTALKGKIERKVALTRTRDAVTIGIRRKVEPPDKEFERVMVKGQLLYADRRRIEKPEIELIDERGAKHRILVPEGMMSDIVKPLWEETVLVTGTRIDRIIKLEDIRRETE